MKNNVVVEVLLIVVVVGVGMFMFLNQPKKVDDTAFRNTFVTSCVEGGSTYTKCDCAFTNLEDRLGLDGLLEMSIKYNQTGIFPTELYGAVTACMSK